MQSGQKWRHCTTISDIQSFRNFDIKISKFEVNALAPKILKRQPFERPQQRISRDSTKSEPSELTVLPHPRHWPASQKFMMVRYRYANVSASHHDHASPPSSRHPPAPSRHHPRAPPKRRTTQDQVISVVRYLHEFKNRDRQTAHLSDLCADTVTSRTWECCFLGSERRRRT